MGSQFKLKNLGHLNYFLGLEIERSHQRKYVLSLLEITDLLGAKPSSVTTKTQHKLKDTTSIVLPDASSYIILVGQLIYLTITRPDL